MAAESLPQELRRRWIFAAWREMVTSLLFFADLRWDCGPIRRKRTALCSPPKHRIDEELAAGTGITGASPHAPLRLRCTRRRRSMAAVGPSWSSLLNGNPEGIGIEAGNYADGGEIAEPVIPLSEEIVINDLGVEDPEVVINNPGVEDPAVVIIQDPPDSNPRVNVAVELGPILPPGS